MRDAQYAVSPEQLTLREAQLGGRILVTTLLEADSVHKAELDALYRRRRGIELDFGCLKTTLDMDVLRCGTPTMIEHELWTYLLAHNLIHLLMAHANSHSGQVPRQLSFKHTVQLWSEWNSRALCRTARAHGTLLRDIIAQVRVRHRPGRCEARARKCRPKSFRWLKVLRHVARRRNPNQPT